MEIILVRHGETEENAAGKVQGQGQGHLSKKGKLQVLEVAKKLSDEKFDAMYSSDLQRCIDTAEGIHAFHKKTPLDFEPALREFSFGRFQGLPANWFWWARGIGARLPFTLPGIDTPKKVEKRIIPFLNQVYKKYPDGKVLMVSHGGPVRIVRGLLSDKNFRELLNDDIPNCSVWRVKMVKEL